MLNSKYRWLRRSSTSNQVGEMLDAVEHWRTRVNERHAQRTTTRPTTSTVGKEVMLCWRWSSYSCLYGKQTKPIRSDFPLGQPDHVPSSWPVLSLQVLHLKVLWLKVLCLLELLANKNTRSPGACFCQAMIANSTCLLSYFIQEHIIK